MRVGRFTTAGLLALALAAAGRAEDGVVVAARVEVPFEHVRAFLPKDGAVLTHVLAKDKWPENAKDPAKNTPFEVNECLELSFGHGLRAKQEMRTEKDGEGKPIGEGIVARDGHLLITAGWRLHVQKPVVGDYFDGTLKAKLALQIDEGRLTCRLHDVEVKANKTLAERFVSVVQDIDVTIARQMQETANEKLIPKLEAEIEGFVQKYPLLGPLKKRLSLRVTPDRLVFSLDNTAPPAPPPPGPSGPWVVEFVPLDKGGSGVSVIVNGEFWAPNADDRDTTWSRAEGAKSRPLPARWQGERSLRLVAVSKDWGQRVKLVVRHGDKVVKTLDFTKDYVAELAAPK